ncbi:MAG: hypothetical protein GF398_11705 [Chitinivibrionales bacterium]|nr:hypothetical protein [Chitinivibrionales bacterium]
MVNRISILISFLIAGLLLQCTEQPLSPPATITPSMIVRNVKAQYLVGSENVRITWAPVDTSLFDYYKIYRTSETVEKFDKASNTFIEVMDTATLISEGSRELIDKNTTEFIDIPGLENDIYHYVVRTLSITRKGFQTREYTVFEKDTTVTRIDTIGTIADTTWGGWVYDELGLAEDDSYDKVRVGSNVSFNINQGDLFTSTDKVSLYLNDPAGKIQSVRLTQNFTTFWAKDNDTIQVNFDDPKNPPSSHEIKQLLAGGWIQSDGKLHRDVVEFEKALFDVYDPANPNAEIESLQEGSNIIPWVLKQGNGEKRVFVELTHRLQGDTSNGNTTVSAARIDTVLDAIKIAPYRVRVTLRNRIGTNDETMRYFQSQLYGEYFLYKPWIKFSVSIFADTTFQREFHYWVGTSSARSHIFERITANNLHWLETAPAIDSLTGTGPDHNDDNEYLYSIGDDEQGRENLSRLLQTQATPQNELAFKLTGSEGFNEIAVPGSYWGENPLYYNTNSNTLESQQRLVSGSYKENFEKFKRLEPIEVFNRGGKEFILICIFKGRFFNDTRTVVVGNSREIGPVKGGIRTYFDLYPPSIQFIDQDNQNWISNDCTLVSSFDYELNATGSVTDKGKADIKDIRLIIARRPDNFPWTISYKLNAYRNVTAENMTIQDLYEMRYFEFPFNIKVPDQNLNDVIWEDINPSDWPSGDYLMAIVTEDQFGNKGFAPILDYVAGLKRITNPWMVTILTGK